MQSEDLHSLKDDMVAFIAGHGLHRMPAYVGEDVAAVMFEDEDPDAWKDFVEHAKAAGASFLTMSEVVLEKSDVSLLIEQLHEHAELRESGISDESASDLEDAEALVRHVGKTGYLQLGFAHQGVMFLYEISTEWYDRFQDLMEAATDIGGLVVDDNDE